MPIITPLTGGAGLTVCDYFQIQYKAKICNFAHAVSNYVSNPAANTVLLTATPQNPYYIVAIELEGDVPFTAQVEWTSGAASKSRQIKHWAPYVTSIEFSPPFNADAPGDANTALTVKIVEGVTGTVRARVVYAW